MSVIYGISMMVGHEKEKVNTGEMYMQRKRLLALKGLGPDMLGAVPRLRLREDENVAKVHVLGAARGKDHGLGNVNRVEGNKVGVHALRNRT